MRYSLVSVLLGLGVLAGAGLAWLDLVPAQPMFFSAVALSCLNAWLMRGEYGSKRYWLYANFFMACIVILAIKALI